MTTPADQAVATFNNSFNCTQAVLSAFAEPLGLPRHVALRIAAPFGGGIGCSGETCGAVTGALMVLGIKHGAETNDPAAKQQAYAVARKFLTAFAARHHTTLCRELIDCDISTPEGMQRARAEHLFDKCPAFVRDAAEITDTLLTESPA